MDTPAHQEDKTQIGRYKTIMTVILCVTDGIQIWLGWLVASDAADKILYKVLQLILLLVLSGCYVKNLFFKFYPGPTVDENKRALKGYRSFMFLLLLGIDFAQICLSIWPLDDKRLNAEIQLGLLGLVSFLYLFNLFVNRYVATVGNNQPYIKGTTERLPEDEVTVNV